MQPKHYQYSIHFKFSFHKLQLNSFLTEVPSIQKLLYDRELCHERGKHDAALLSSSAVSVNKNHFIKIFIIFLIYIVLPHYSCASTSVSCTKPNLLKQPSVWN